MLEDFRPAPIDIFGSRCTLIDRSDLQVGLSPDCQNVEFFPGGCASRVGFIERSKQAVSRFSSIASFVNNSGAVPSITRVLLTESGALYYETGTWPGVTPALTQITTGLGLNMRMKACSYGNRIFLAFSNGWIPKARARGWDGTYLDPLSLGENAHSPAVDASMGAAAAGNMGGYLRAIQVAETRHGYLTPPSRAWGPIYVDPDKVWTVLDLSPYPSNTSVVRRRLYVTIGTTTAAANIPRYYTHPVLWENGPIGTAYYFTVQKITEDMLTGYAATDISGLTVGAGIRPLPHCVGLASYSSRLVAWGVAHAIPRLSLSYDAQGLSSGPQGNLSYDGGSEPADYYGTPSRDVPNLWNHSAGAASIVWADSIPGSCGRALKLSAGTSDYYYGAQTLEHFVNQEPSPSGTYMVRFRAIKSAGFDGTLRVWVSTFTKITYPAGTLSTDWEWYEGTLFDKTITPSTTVLKWDISGGSTGYVAIDEFQVYPVEQAYDLSTLMISEFNDPESFIYGTGEIGINENDGQRITNCYELRGVLRVAKQHSLYSVVDTGGTPDTWSVERASDSIGALGPWAVGQGEGWAVLADDSGIYIDNGGMPLKISQEIQPDWDQLNLTYAYLTTVTVDTRAKRIYVLYPSGSSSYCNAMLMCDYVEGSGDPIEGGGRGRKWTSWSTANFRINDMGYVLDGDGQGHIMFAGGAYANRGAILMQDPSGVTLCDKYTDTGDATVSDPINAFYETASIGADQGRSLFGYLSARIRGTGTLTTQLVRSNGELIALPDRVLSSDPIHDTEFMLHQTGIQYGVRIGVNGAGDSFSVRRLSLFVKPAPFSLLRGHNK